MRALVLALVSAAIVLPGAAKETRSGVVIRQFRQHHACPSTGRTVGACPGWQVDHIIALCAGGADTPANMQWLTLAEHRQKTRADIYACRRGRPSPSSE